MYNRYLDDDSFVLLEPEGQSHSGQGRQGPNPGQSQGQGRHRPGPPPSGGQHRPAEPLRSKSDLLGEVTGALGQLLDGVSKHFSLENFDTGDILLVLIILFLYLEGDDLELVITLGLLLLLGLDDDKPQEE